MRFAICDDMPVFLEQLDVIIRNVFPDKSECLFIDEFNSGEALLTDFRAEKYDAIFLDVQMEEMNGIQAANEIRKTDRNVIIAFHTSNDKLDVSGYDVGTYTHIRKGQNSYTYKEQFRSIFAECIDIKQEKLHPN